MNFDLQYLSFGIYSSVVYGMSQEYIFYFERTRRDYRDSLITIGDRIDWRNWKKANKQNNARPSLKTTSCTMRPSFFTPLYITIFVPRLVSISPWVFSNFLLASGIGQAEKLRSGICCWRKKRTERHLRSGFVRLQYFAVFCLLIVIYRFFWRRFLGIVILSDFRTFEN